MVAAMAEMEAEIEALHMQLKAKKEGVLVSSW
jgi:hypothetical protein